MKPIADRFWSKVRVGATDECWPWLGAIGSGGYGMFRRDTRHIRANRMAWILTYGEIPEHMLACHKCDNPPCCNPAHLFLGTFKDNMADMRSKNRQSRRGAAKLTTEQVGEVRRGFWYAGLDTRDLAEKYQMSQSGIGSLVYMHNRIGDHPVCLRPAQFYLLLEDGSARYVCAEHLNSVRDYFASSHPRIVPLGSGQPFSCCQVE